MISTLGQRLAEGFRRTAPDPFVIAVLLTLLTAALALLVGFGRGDDPAGLRERVVVLIDAWRADSGLWKFLAFGMQMCLILVTGHALAASPPVRRLLGAISGVPRDTRSAVVLVSLAACLAGLVNWGLGLIVGAILARDVARSLRARGVHGSEALLAAAGYTCMAVWHGGLSGSAPLSVTSPENAAKVLPAQVMADLGLTSIPLDQTLFSTLNLVATGGLVVLIPLILILLVPKPGSAAESGVIPPAPESPPAACSPSPDPSLPDWLERTPWVAWALAMLLVVALARFLDVRSFMDLGLNEINAGMFALGLLLHGSVRSYVAAVEDGARGCAGIIVQFPLYAGIMAMMGVSGLAAMISTAISGGGETGVPLLTFLSAGVLNLFVPSGGGQWGIQGPIALQAGFDVGVAPGKMVMAVAFGDQLTNLLQPFWALPLLAITGVKAREIVGYTAIVMVAAGAWLGVCLWLL